MNQKVSETIELSISVKASPEEIWQVLTDPDELENWWGDGVRLEPRVGGVFSEPWEDDKGTRQMASGKVKTLKKKQEISFTWTEKSWPTEAQTICAITIEDKKMIRMIHLKHTGWETLPADIRNKTLKDFKVGWNYHLKELQAYLDE